MTNNVIIEDLRLLAPPPWYANPWFILLAAVAMAVIGWMLYRYFSRPRTKIIPSRASGPGPHIEALRRLADLRRRWKELTAYALAIEVSDILRTYLEPRFGLPAPFQTTREFLEGAMAQSELEPDQCAQLKRFLEFCDLVKFAQRPATELEQGQLLDTAEQFVRKTSEGLG
jgi:hypothetical protein